MSNRVKKNQSEWDGVPMWKINEIMLAQAVAEIKGLREALEWIMHSSNEFPAIQNKAKEALGIK